MRWRLSPWILRMPMASTERVVKERVGLDYYFLDWIFRICVSDSMRAGRSARIPGSRVLLGLSNFAFGPQNK
jgi:hypothetical protein